MKEKIHSLWWLWVPAVFLLFNAWLQVYAPAEIVSMFLTERGPYETIQPLIIAGAFLMALLSLSHLSAKNTPWLFAWVGLGVLGSFYIIGEEISWGQHIFHWSTPEEWAALNDHNETNLHNTTSWLDQKPRTLIEIGMLVGGLLIPFLQKFKPTWVPARFNMIYPPAVMGVTAACLWFSKVFEDLNKVYEMISLQRISEINEIYMYYFILLYFVLLRQRLVSGS
jgi:hypothetical protein